MKTEATVDRTTQAALEITDLGVAYESTWVLDHIDLTVQQGEFIGIIGPNGAGKSTLLKTVAGLIRPTRGEFRFPAASGRRHPVGYVPQRFDLEPDLPLRARDLVGLGLDGHRWGFAWPNSQRSRKIEQALAQVDLSGFADHPAGKLSGGQLQRVLIAQALVSDPELLLLDEPLSSLDLASAQTVVDVVHRVSQNLGVTVLLVTHDMNPLLPVMDRIIYVVNGQAVIGTVDQVVQKDVLDKLYGYDVEVLRLHGRILVVGDETASGDAAGFEHR